MIVAALCELYDRLGEMMPKRHWGAEKVAGELRIDKDGNLVGVYSYADEPKGQKILQVPEHDSRTSAVKAFFMCDKAAYLFGRDAKHGQEMFEASRDLHNRVLGGVEDDGALAVLRFYEKDENRQRHLDSLEALDGKLLVFRGTWDNRLIHEREKIVAAWMDFKQERLKGTKVQCAVTGEQDMAANLFPQVSGVQGGQSSGVSLISYNDECYCSYGRTSKDKALNASIGERAAFKAGAALKYLFSDRAHRVSYCGTHVLFWTESCQAEDDEFLRLALGLDIASMAGEDEVLLERLRATLGDIRKGKKPVGVDESARYHVLGVTPNAARLAVRFYDRGTLGRLEENLKSYLDDIDMVGEQDMNRSIGYYLERVAPLGDKKNVPNTLTASATEAVLRGKPLPNSLFTAAIGRMRADKGKERGVTAYRAAIMRAFLRRKARLGNDYELERSLTVALNEENRNQGYLLGRLFAALEKAQGDAIGSKLNASIKDRYIGAASSTPAKVFPQLLKGAQHHVAKTEYGATNDRRIEEIIALMDAQTAFPATLDYDDQGQFFIGYYQQKEAIYTKRSGKEASNE
jgi:CRISPR-associated protein Csd1